MMIFKMFRYTQPKIFFFNFQISIIIIDLQITIGTYYVCYKFMIIITIVI